MTFSSNSRFMARAQLVDTAGHARAALAVRVCSRASAMTSPLPIVELAGGESSSTGQLELELTSEHVLGGPSLPALALFWSHEGSLRWLSETVERVDVVGRDVIFDFGRVVVADSPFATLGSTPCFGLPAPLHALLAGEGHAADALREDARAASRRAAELEGPSGPVDLASVLQGIGEQLERVEREGGARSHRLGKVSLSLKVLPSAGGTKVRFMDAKELEGSASAVSSLEVDFVPCPLPLEAHRAGIELPDLCGDTEAMARRRASALGLSVEIMQRELAPDDVTRAGQVVAQMPPAGTSVRPGARLTLLVGKESQQARGEHHGRR